MVPTFFPVSGNGVCLLIVGTMTEDRDAILAGTEELVRNGRYEVAITEFERFVHQHPSAWAMAAMLVDLFRRAGETAAVEGRSAEAIGYFELVANWRAARGDLRGAEELRGRIEVLEVQDLEAQLEAIRSDRAANAGPEEAEAVVLAEWPK
jgi:hypothetical protein